MIQWNASLLSLVYYSWYMKTPMVFFVYAEKKEEENQDYNLICTYIFIYEVYFIHFIYNTCNFECLFMFSLLHYAHIYLYC